MGQSPSHFDFGRVFRARRMLGTGVLCGTLSASAAAQTVRGTVTSAGQPIPGVLLTLMDTASHVAARTLSDAQGQYVLVAPAPGRYRIYSLRIGYRPGSSDWLDLGGGAQISRPIALAGIPVALDAVRVLGRGECRLAADSSAATFAIWEQARGAMIAARVSSQKDSLLATKILYEKTLDRSMRVQSSRYAVAQSVVADPWRSPSPDVLERVGFVTTDSKGYVTYNAPDLDVLLSDRFTLNHCFRLTESTDSTRIGLEFQPTDARASTRGISEIQGTIWLDRPSSELRSMEFGYTNLPWQSAQVAGGEIHFSRLRNGGFTIGEWSLRMPVVAIDRMNFRSDVGVEARLTSVEIVGGQLIVAARGTDTIFALPGLRVRGTVRDSVTRSPVIGARVQITGTAIDVITDSTGSFEGDGLRPGVYYLEVHTPSLDSIGAMNRVEFEFVDTSKAADIRVPSARQVAAALCPATSARSPRGLLIGAVTAPQNAPWSVTDKDVAIVARWTDASSKDRVHEMTAKPDAGGTFRMCGVPLEAPLAVRASVDQRSGLPIEVRVSSQYRFARLSLLATDKPVARLAGLVRADSTTTPLAAADVLLPDEGRSVRSDDRGRFQIDSVELGRHHIVVRHIGYEMIDTTIVLDGKDIFEPEFHLRRTAVLDSVRVVADSRDLRLREFEENKKLGLGHFFDWADLAKKEGLRLAAVLGDVLGARIVSSSGGSALASTRGAITSLRNQVLDVGPGNKRDCYSTVYVDNVPVFRSGRGDPYFNLNLMRPEDIEAIEFYAGPSELPARYNQLNAACGVLVIHTRRR
jgi:hypothetical protein